jgi:DNA invertase Pin-like site-specific DNA recombinase
MMVRKRKKYRCAIYTRKSSEEGLEQEFNSLDAQYEACAAYITSQRHEGWALNKERYDDGGISGGTMVRPGLQRLLDDIKANRVDIIVVYKVDRLTRALSDFAKMVEIFDANEVSFVSITQQFNTTNSMGRLTLNVLLSFAQFEREVTGERIRDKVAASKRKGMWMGGHVPLGYDVVDRKLAINQSEARTVQTLFDLYREHGSARAVQSLAKQHGLRSKIRQTKDGTSRGGKPFGRGHIYQILSNPLYVGEIRHKDAVYPGEHDAIIDRELWETVQRQLASNRATRRTGTNSKEPSLLAGILFDSAGNRFTPSHAVKNGQRYRYYVERSLIVERSEGNSRGRRLAADEIEGVVVGALVDYLQRPDRLMFGDDKDQLAAHHYEQVLTASKRVADELGGNDNNRRRELVTQLVGRIVIGDGSLCIDISRAGISSLCGLPSTEEDDDPICQIDVPIQRRYRGGALKLVMTGEGTPPRREPDRALIKVIVRAHDWWARLLSGEAASTADIAQQENLTRRYVNQLLRLAFLDPAITKSILEGTQPVELTAKTLSNRPAIPDLWADQRHFLGFDPR